MESGPVDEKTLQVMPIRLGCDVGLLEGLTRLLDESERERLDNYRLPHLRTRFLEAHAALRLLLARRLSVAPERLRFEYGQHGKPALASHRDCGLSFAHSGDMAVLAAGWRCEMGVDVEAPRDIRERDGIVRRYFAPREQMAYFATPAAERPATFLRGWTRKEAYLKARGEGLVTSLDRFEVSLGAEGSPTLIPIESSEEWQIASLALPYEYTGALVYQGQRRTICVNRIVSLEQLIGI